MKHTPSTLWQPQSLAKMAIVAALYVALTFVSPISFHAWQFRISESLNYLGLYHRRYIIAVTVGVAIANLFSPFLLYDVVIGSATTFAALIVSVKLSERVNSWPLKYAIMALVCTLFMFTIAGLIVYLEHVPFWPTYAALMVSEAGSMAMGAVIFLVIAPRLPLSQ